MVHSDRPQRVRETRRRHTTRWQQGSNRPIGHAEPRGFFLVDNVIPEDFLMKALPDAAYELEEALARAGQGVS